MGMFNWVDYECLCPVCGEEVTGFQSKDRNCDMRTLTTDDVDNFYAGCDNCKTWIEFDRQPTFAMRYKTKDGREHFPD